MLSKDQFPALFTPQTSMLKKYCGIPFTGSRLLGIIRVQKCCYFYIVSVGRFHEARGGRIWWCAQWETSQSVCQQMLLSHIHCKFVRYCSITTVSWRGIKSKNYFFLTAAWLFPALDLLGRTLGQNINTHLWFKGEIRKPWGWTWFLGFFLSAICPGWRQPWWVTHQWSVFYNSV